MSNQNICNICGANYEYIGGRWKCPACGAFKAEELSNEEVTLLYNAAQKLRLCDFNEAEIEYADIIEKFPKNPEGYWGRLLARYGIKYEEDFDGRKIPTCYAASIKSIFGDPDYEKAMSLFSEADSTYYKAQAEYIERVRKEWIEKASKEQPYDIFLCYKDSDLANGIDRTPDSIAVQDIYIHLIEQGYRVFYSRESLRNKVGEKYEPYIFNALSTAKVMLVYGSKPEYITSTWLKNEWTRYIKRIQAGEKLQNSLLVACDGFSPDLLPNTLSSRQCFDATKRSFYIDLDKALEKAVNDPFYTSKTAFVYKIDDYIQENEEDESYELDEENEEDDDDFEIGMGYEEEDSQEYKVPEFTDDDFEETPKKKTPLPILFIFLALLVITPIVWFSYLSMKQPDSSQDTTSSSVPEEKLTITFVTESGTLVKKLTTKKGESINSYYIPPVPQKNGYIGNWNITDFSKLTKDTIVTPVYTVKHYSIAYVLNGGTNNKSNPTSYSINSGAKLALYNPTLANYSFDGWYLEPDFKTNVEYIDTSKLQNLTLYAKWKLQSYFISYVLNGGTNNIANPLTFKANSGNITLTVPSRTGYTFNGWYTDSGFSTKITSINTNNPKNITLYAKWEIINYTITYELNGGTNNSLNPKKYTVESGNITLAEPTREGYTFKGWYSDFGFNTKVTAIDTSKLQYIILYAKWEAVTTEPETYTVNYNLNGGTNNTSNPSAFEANSGNITLADPTRAGYTFKGWYSDAGFSTKVTAIDTSKLTSITLYAKWEKFPFTYTINNGEATITGYSGGNEVVIPAEINGVPVTAIGEDAFNQKTNIKSVTIPDSVTTIGQEAFCFCDALANVTIGNGVEIIGQSAFYYCYALTSVTIPDSVKTIGQKAFYNCDALTSVTIGNGVQTIGQEAFCFCDALTSVTIGNSVQTIGQQAFSSCDALTSVTIGNSVQTIGQEAFSYCYALTSVTIPDSVISIEETAFQYCYNLASVTLGKNLFAIGSSAFYGCYSLVEVYDLSDALNITAGSGSNGNVASYALDVYTSKSSPSSVRVEDGFIFYEKGDTRYLLGYNGSKTEITLPESCSGKDYEIYKYAFYGSDITSITIPKKVTAIGPYTFASCSNLKKIVFDDPAEWYYSSYSDGRNGIDIPETSLSSPTTAASIIKTIKDKCIIKK